METLTFVPETKGRSHGSNSEHKGLQIPILGDPAERFAEHLASKTNRSTLRYKVVETGLNKTQARIREQYWINYFGMEKNGGQLYNQINSIAPKYWNNFSIKVEVTNLP